ncbi:ATP-binding protein [Streptomyces diastatochromogenes]|uniref:ATP-binding protein n=1 Tax=Streptomyces diastatochromogenes TaxID=42236 RepID=UPI0036B1C0E9
MLRAGAAGRPEAADARERALYSAALDVGVRVVGPDGSFSGGPQPGSDVRLPARTGAPVTVRADGASWRALARPVRTPLASGTLRVFASDTADGGQQRLVRRRVLVTTVLATPCPACWPGGWPRVPPRRLTRRTAGLDPRTDRVRLPLERTGVTEVDELAATIRTVPARYDEQAARTAEALDTARSFSAAAAHELRTPLMGIGTNLDIMAGHPGLPEPDRTGVVADVRREHGRLLGLLLMLRDLGQGDLVEAETFRTADLTEIAEAAVAEARSHAPGALIVLDATAAITVRGWEPGLRLLLDNLLANGVAHGADAGGLVSVTVGLRRAGEWIVLTVDDGGPGVPGAGPGAVPARPGQRRLRALGLTLVAQQTALHRGAVTAGGAPGGTGARFEVRLPAGEGELPNRRGWLIGTAETYRSQGFLEEDSYPAAGRADEWSARERRNVIERWDLIGLR